MEDTVKKRRKIKLDEPLIVSSKKYKVGDYVIVSLIDQPFRVKHSILDGALLAMAYLARGDNKSYYLEPVYEPRHLMPFEPIPLTAIVEKITQGQVINMLSRAIAYQVPEYYSLERAAQESVTQQSYESRKEEVIARNMGFDSLANDKYMLAVQGKIEETIRITATKGHISMSDFDKFCRANKGAAEAFASLTQTLRRSGSSFESFNSNILRGISYEA